MVFDDKINFEKKLKILKTFVEIEKWHSIIVLNNALHFSKYLGIRNIFLYLINII